MKLKIVDHDNEKNIIEIGKEVERERKILENEQSEKLNQKDEDAYIK